MEMRSSTFASEVGLDRAGVRVRTPVRGRVRFAAVRRPAVWHHAGVRPRAPMLPLSVLQSLFEQLPVGVVLLDDAGRVVHYNRYEEQLAGRKRESVMGKEFFREVAPCMNVRELGGRFYAEIGKRALAVQIEFAFPFPQLAQPRDVVVRMTSFDVEGRPYGCLLIEDISAKRSVERMKDTLSSLLVHDLKNPLAVAMTNLGILREIDAVASDPDAREALEGAVRAGRRLQRMIHNLLDIARLESPTMRLVRCPVDVAAIARAALDEQRPLAKLRGVHLALHAPDRPVVATVDEDVLRRTIDNLVENGVRHAKSVVDAYVEDDGAGGLRLVVDDDGPGIPPEVRERVFEKWVQVVDEPKGPRRHMNQGLGLTFVQLAVRAHGGTVQAESSPSGGCRFVLTLPRVTGPGIGEPTSAA
jgi:photoactive yellow protein